MASGSESESDDLCVVLDADGRVFGAGEGLDYAFRAFDAFAPLVPAGGRSPTSEDENDLTSSSPSTPPSSIDDLVADALLVDSPLAGDAATHWLSARAARAPRCALEELAAAIFAFHTRDLRGPDAFEESSSGVEWWVQARPSLKLHWDKDEELRVATGLWVHPQVSTVTYLTGGGSGGTRQAPTVVFEGVVAGPVARGHGGGGGGDDVTSAGSPRASAMCASYPEAGKHVSFDGRMLHGVLRELADGGGGGGGGRITFLANVWLNHAPRGVKPLPGSILPSLGPPSTGPTPAVAAPRDAAVTTTTVTVSDTDTCASVATASDAFSDERVFGWSGDEFALSDGARRGARAIRDAGSASGTVRVALPPECGVDVFVVENEGVGIAEKKRRAG